MKRAVTALRTAETTLYVADPIAAANLYSRAFGYPVGFTMGDMYASLGTKDKPIRLAFASHSWAEGTHGKGAFAWSTAKDKPTGFEVCVPADDIDATFKNAVKAGFQSLKAPFDTVWGARMAYVRDENGFVISLSRPSPPLAEGGEGAGAAAETPSKNKGKGKGKSSATKVAEVANMKSRRPSQLA